MEILINHLGYDREGPKKAIIKNSKEEPGGESLFSSFSIHQADSGKTIFTGKPVYNGPVDSWRDWLFWTIDFSKVAEQGEFFITAAGAETHLQSCRFQIKSFVLASSLPAILAYFRSQHCTGTANDADSRVPFFGNRRDRVDVHGGWYDAAGDTSKYLTHLSYANFMNPQHTPMVVWNLLHALEILYEATGETANLRTALLEEAVYGADFLVRMQDREGYFYTGIFDRWTKRPEEREICSFRGKGGHKSEDYQAGFRQGGGMAIAALARISTMAGFLDSLSSHGDFTPEVYLAAAVKGFDHLLEHNTEYLNDGRENIIDDYCALLAAVELFGAKRDEKYLEAARLRTANLVYRISSDSLYSGWLRADDTGERPYYHAVEAGLPVIALCRYMHFEPDMAFKQKAAEAITSCLTFDLSITKEVPNPFGYARQYVKSVNGKKRSSFFMPHKNETGYWWQGEDARIASLAAAARLSLSVIESDSSQASTLKKYAADQLDWILGLNPFDTCMLQGFGRNNPEYETHYPNSYGGICNGITAGFYDERDIDFLPEGISDRGDQRWRWSEQWLPHGAWYFLAVCCEFLAKTG